MSELDYFFPAAHGGRRGVPHLVVLLPGIGGSELRNRRGEVLWGLSAGAVRKAVRGAEELTAADGRLWDPDFDDGVTASGMLAIPVPGLTRILGGYTGLRKALRREFDLTEGNYLEFPYDWRRPIEVNAGRLAAAVGERLARLRQTRPDARVVIVAHSMGGLVARWYADHLDQAGDCHRLITLGTPYRGAVKALDFLVNGPKLGPVRFRALAELLGRLPGVYGLLPMYRMVVDQRTPGPHSVRYVTDVLDGLPALQADRVHQSRDFLTRLNARSDRPWVTQPIAGFGPATPQQAVLRADGLKASERADLLPASYTMSGGDGTVPVLSARPGNSRGVTVGYDNQSHGGLVKGPTAIKATTLALHSVLDDLESHDPALQPGDEPVMPGRDPGVPDEAPCVETAVSDFYAADEPVRIEGRVRNWGRGRRLWARIEGHGGPQEVAIGGDGAFRLVTRPMDEGLYGFSLAGDPGGPALVSDVIEVG